MKQITGFIKAFHENSNRSTGIIHNKIHGSLVSKADFELKEIW